VLLLIWSLFVSQSSKNIIDLREVLFDRNATAAQMLNLDKSKPVELIGIEDVYHNLCFFSANLYSVTLVQDLIAQASELADKKEFIYVASGELENQVKVLSSEIDERAAYNAELENKLAVLRGQHAGFQKEKLTIEQEIDGYEQQAQIISDLKRKLFPLKSSQTDFHTQKQTLEMQIAELQNELISIPSQLRALQEDQDLLLHQLDTEKLKLSQLERQVNDVKETAASVAAEKENLEYSLSELKDKEAENTDDIIRLQQQIANKKEQLGDNRTNKVESESALLKLQQTHQDETEKMSQHGQYIKAIMDKIEKGSSATSSGPRTPSTSAWSRMTLERDQQ
jgi:chromosome segregation ATPase